MTEISKGVDAQISIGGELIPGKVRINGFELLPVVINTTWPQPPYYAQRPELTENQRIALQDAADGLTLKAAASKRGYTVRSIDRHRAGAMRALSAANTTEAVAIAIRLRIIS